MVKEGGAYQSVGLLEDEGVTLLILSALQGSFVYNTRMSICTRWYDGQGMWYGWEDGVCDFAFGDECIDARLAALRFGQAEDRRTCGKRRARTRTSHSLPTRHILVAASHLLDPHKEDLTRDHDCADPTLHTSSIPQGKGIPPRYSPEEQVSSHLHIHSSPPQRSLSMGKKKGGKKAGGELW